MRFQLTDIFRRIHRKLHRHVIPGGEICRVGQYQRIHCAGTFHQQRFSVFNRPGEVLQDLMLAGYIRLKILLRHYGVEFLA